MQGILIWAFRRAVWLGSLIGQDVSNYTKLVSLMTNASLSTFWDAKAGVFVSNGQISWASQVCVKESK